ncbi:MAG: EF-hand domain-containing protein [Pseudomonadota bacterium]
MKTTAGYLMAAVVLVCLTIGISLAGQRYGEGKEDKVAGKMMNTNFADLDSNTDGYINFEEYKTAFPSSEKKGFDFLDTNKDSQLDPDEWLVFTDMHTEMGKKHKTKYHAGKLPDPSGFNAHFGDMDADGNDLVTMEEFKSHFSGKANAGKVFNAVDKDENNTLDHDEWHEFKAAHGLKHIE